MKPLVVAPSIRSADLGRLAEEVRAVDAAGADWIHVDVIDGRFVPNISFGPAVLAAVRRTTAKSLNVHLMIVEPERLIDDFARAGADHILIQSEPTNPGFGGQAFLPEVLPKIRQLRQLCAARGLDPWIEIDGGQNGDNAWQAVAGADALVAGSAIFGSDDYAAAIARLRAHALPARTADHHVGRFLPCAARSAAATQRICGLSSSMALNLLSNGRCHVGLSSSGGSRASWKDRTVTAPCTACADRAARRACYPNDELLKDDAMQLGMIELGRMGANMVRRLLKNDHACVVYDVHPEAVSALAKDGAMGASSLADMVAKMSAPRAIWMMVPAVIVDGELEKLVPHLEPGDIVIDGGNSYERFASRGESDFANQVLSAMRHAFGGHLEKPAGGAA